MTNAIIVPFHQYTPRVNDDYKVYWNIWYDCYRKWDDLIDKVYLIDHYWNFNATDYQFDPKSKFQVEKVCETHWDNLAKIIPKITEDRIIMMDSDMLVYDRNLMKLIINSNDDVITIMDGSGGISLSDHFPIMSPNENRAERRRFAPYLCGIKRDLMMKTSLAFQPHNTGQADWMDSFGLWTKDILSHNPSIKELQDDRTTLRLFEDGHISKDTWLDGSPYKWSIPVDAPCRTGCYHIRNWNEAVRLVNNYYFDKDQYNHQKEIVPFCEAIRLLTWYYIVVSKYKPQEIGYNNQSATKNSKIQRQLSAKDNMLSTDILGKINTILGKINTILNDYKVKNFDLYVSEFYKYHSWISEI